MTARPTPASERLDALWVPSAAMTDRHVVFDELRIAWVESFDEDGPYYGNVCHERTGALAGAGDWTKAPPLSDVKRHLAHQAIGKLLALLDPGVQPLVLTFDTEAERAAVIEAVRRVAPASVGRAVGA